MSAKINIQQLIKHEQAEHNIAEMQGLPVTSNLLSPHSQYILHSHTELVMPVLNCCEQAKNESQLHVIGKSN